MRRRPGKVQAAQGNKTEDSITLYICSFYKIISSSSNEKHSERDRSLEIQKELREPGILEQSRVSHLVHPSTSGQGGPPKEQLK